MTNHVHLVVTPEREDSLAKMGTVPSAVSPRTETGLSLFLRVQGAAAFRPSVAESLLFVCVGRGARAQCGCLRGAESCACGNGERALDPNSVLVG